MTTATTTKWGIDNAHSELSFKVRHMMVSNVRGKFGKFDGKINTTEDDFTNAEIEINIESNSVLTGDDQRDGHLKSPDFFDVAKYPEITIKL